jgi:hypothetical protein
MIRHYKPEDEAAVREIFAAQGLDVHLPLPGKDPACLGMLVEEENGVVQRAIIARLTVETQLVTRPDAPVGEARKIRTLAHNMQGFLLGKAEDFEKLKMGSLRDVMIEVPVTMPLMNDLVKLLGFEPELEAPDMTLYYCVLGQLGGSNGTEKSAKSSG